MNQRGEFREIYEKIDMSYYRNKWLPNRCNSYSTNKQIISELSNIFPKFITRYDIGQLMNNKKSFWENFFCYCGNKKKNIRSITCCSKCAANLDSTKEKRIETNVRVYGTKCSFQNEQVKLKARKTMMKRYGGTNTLNSSLKEKVKNTIENRYGADNIFKTEYHQNTIIKDCIKNHTVEFYMNRKKIRLLYNQSNKQVSLTTKLKRYRRILKDNYILTKSLLKYILWAIQNFGVPRYNKTEKGKKKIISTNIKRYGGNSPMCSSEVQEKHRESHIERYGVPVYTQSESYKEKIPCITKKCYNTKKKNNSFNTSKPEKKLLNVLELFFDDIEYQYKSKEYPFNCDFYIPSIDTYIEYNGTWTHGKEPYDKDNKEHKRILKDWKERSKTSKYYKIAIGTWTKRDVKKRKVAKKNGLNYLEFFSYKEAVRYIIYNLDW